MLDCVEKIAGKNITVLSAGTDGRDGSSFAAGAVADGETLARARAAGLDPRDFSQRSDSYSFFQRTGRCDRNRSPRALIYATCAF